MRFDPYLTRTEYYLMLSVSYQLGLIGTNFNPSLRFRLFYHSVSTSSPDYLPVLIILFFPSLEFNENFNGDGVLPFRFVTTFDWRYGHMGKKLTPINAYKARKLYETGLSADQKALFDETYNEKYDEVITAASIMMDIGHPEYQSNIENHDAAEENAMNAAWASIGYSVV